MTYFIADAVTLMSIAKPITFGVFVGLWAYAVGYIDKDAKFFYLKRQMWNAIHLGVGVLAWFLVITIPIFWVGLPLALVMIIGILLDWFVTRYVLERSYLATRRAPPRPPTRTHRRRLRTPPARRGRPLAGVLRAGEGSD